MAFLRNAWYVAAHAHELDGGRLAARSILGDPALVDEDDLPEIGYLDNPAIGESPSRSVVEGFNEDKAIIEGQQRMLNADPGFRFQTIVADAALAHFRRPIDKRLAEQAAAQALRPMRAPAGAAAKAAR